MAPYQTGPGPANSARREAAVQVGDALQALVRQGTREMLARALEEEVDEMLGRGPYERGTVRAYRNGHAPERAIGTGLGRVGVRAPWVSDWPSVRDLSAGRRQALSAEPWLPQISCRCSRAALPHMRGQSRGSEVYSHLIWTVEDHMKVEKARERIPTLLKIESQNGELIKVIAAWCGATGASQPASEVVQEYRAWAQTTGRLWRQFVMMNAAKPDVIRQHGEGN